VQKTRVRKALWQVFLGLANVENPDCTETDTVARNLGRKITHPWKQRNLVFYPIRERISLPPRSRFLRTTDKSELMAEIGINLVERYFRLPPDPDDANVRVATVC